MVFYIIVTVIFFRFAYFFSAKRFIFISSFSVLINFWVVQSIGVPIGAFLYYLNYGNEGIWGEPSLGDLYIEKHTIRFYFSLICMLSTSLISDSYGDSIVNCSISELFSSIPYLLTFGPLFDIIYIGPSVVALYPISLTCYIIKQKGPFKVKVILRILSVLVAVSRVMFGDLVEILNNITNSIVQSDKVLILLLFIATVIMFLFVKRNDRWLVVRMLMDGQKDALRPILAHPQWPLVVKLAYRMLQTRHGQAHHKEIAALARALDIPASLLVLDHDSAARHAKGTT